MSVFKIRLGVAKPKPPIWKNQVDPCLAHQKKQHISGLQFLQKLNILINIDISLLKAIVIVGDFVVCQGIQVLVLINLFEMFEA